ncbi:MAG: hypothetical protein Q8P61_04005, partial [Candidatus Nanopelagicales bacterium]|nr:hypothetical protein [Candidatus Nanopelagicales bacterium]
MVSLSGGTEPTDALPHSENFTVACHVHGTGLIGFLPGSWDHLSCQLLDHLSACCGSGFLVLPLDLRF